MLIVEVIVFLVLSVILAGSGYALGQFIAKATQTEKFRCPYCNLLVIGAQTMDKMEHILCIDRAPADLEAMHKKAIAVEDEYFRTISIARREGMFPDISLCYYDNGYWKTYQHELFRNGESIHKGHSPTKTKAEATLTQQEGLDRHKRKTAILRKER